MLKNGWNTWNVRSVTSHVCLPEAFAISLGFKVYNSGRCLREILIGRAGKMDEKVVPGPHAYDGSYTSLEVTWPAQGVSTDCLKVRVETAHDGNDWYARVTPLSELVTPPALTIEGAVLWNRPGSVRREGGSLIIENGNRTITVQATGTPRHEEPVVEITSPYLLVTLDTPVLIATNPDKLAAADEVIDGRKSEFQKSRESLSEVHNAMQICLAWDTMYDPFKDRIISPVSRLWSCSSGGWVLFDWDTYFAAWMAGVEDKELAYANATAITDEATERGFIPNFAHPSGFKSRDRSQPPVGAMTVQALCDMFGETLLAERLFDPLLKWNRWWPEHRDKDGYLCWGSDPYEPTTGCQWETHGVNERFGGALESGLDNSPMYDDVAFDPEIHLLLLADVGLMSLYVADCLALADLAGRIGRGEVVNELTERAERYADKLKSMWCEKTGLFLNKNLATGQYCPRLSPTHFYPLIAGVATPEQARRMIDEHFFNPDEFWGEWMLPSIARNDPAYPDQRYWRGRIWAPMNFLVYLGLRNYDLPEARKALVEKSEALLLKEWREKGHVHENYHCDTGTGCDIGSSDAFYHWGGLLGLISVMEE
ncbi:MAG: trehalase family glycosidase [Lentisphaeria bacterium]|nr:trehalase family glycosidase [Lentisphaeria bacterium]